jgi:hypothetical protein
MQKFSFVHNDLYIDIQIICLTLTQQFSNKVHIILTDVIFVD